MPISTFANRRSGQVFENTESTKRQYALRHRAVALGWALDRIITIDSDLGQSGASAIDREGFQPLVAEIGVGCWYLYSAWKSSLSLAIRQTGIVCWRSAHAF
jgi:hypothetical protein